MKNIVKIATGRGYKSIYYFFIDFKLIVLISMHIKKTAVAYPTTALLPHTAQIDYLSEHWAV
jgi:hypothetical protein